MPRNSSGRITVPRWQHNDLFRDDTDSSSDDDIDSSSSSSSISAASSIGSPRIRSPRSIFTPSPPNSPARSRSSHSSAASHVSRSSSSSSSDNNADDHIFSSDSENGANSDHNSGDNSNRNLNSDSDNSPHNSDSDSEGLGPHNSPGRLLSRLVRRAARRNRHSSSSPPPVLSNSNSSASDDRLSNISVAGSSVVGHGRRSRGSNDSNDFFDLAGLDSDSEIDRLSPVGHPEDQEPFVSFRNLIRNLRRSPTPPNYFGFADRQESNDSSDNSDASLDEDDNLTASQSSIESRGVEASEETMRVAKATTSAGSSRTPSSAAGTRASSISYECSVCLENLDAPASIDEPGEQGNEGNDPIAFQHPRMRIGGMSGGRRGRGGIAITPAPRRAVPQNQNVSPTDVVATHCGHLYHQICLEKWFAEQGRRTCPSCRKNVPKAKMIRLYPNISEDTGTKNQNGGFPPPPPTANLPGPSSGVPGPSSGAPGPSNAVVPVAGSSSTAQVPVPPVTVVVDANGPCTKPECQDLKVIHNTLITDYNDLQARFNELREDNQVKEAQIQSLDEDNFRQSTEIQRLKRQLEEERPAPAPTSTNKRRRR